MESWIYQGWRSCCENFDEQVVLTGNRDFTGCMGTEWYQRAKWRYIDDKA